MSNEEVLDFFLPTAHTHAKMPLYQTLCYISLSIRLRLHSCSCDKQNKTYFWVNLLLILKIRDVRHASSLSAEEQFAI